MAMLTLSAFHRFHWTRNFSLSFEAPSGRRQQVPRRPARSLRSPATKRPRRLRARVLPTHAVERPAHPRAQPKLSTEYGGSSSALVLLDAKRARPGSSSHRRTATRRSSRKAVWLGPTSAIVGPHCGVGTGCRGRPGGGACRPPLRCQHFVPSAPTAYARWPTRHRSPARAVAPRRR